MGETTYHQGQKRPEPTSVERTWVQVHPKPGGARGALINVQTQCQLKVLEIFYDAQLLLDTTKKTVKEVIQPHLPVRLPCYDFSGITRFTFGHCAPAARLWTLGVPDFA